MLSQQEYFTFNHAFYLRVTTELFFEFVTYHGLQVRNVIVTNYICLTSFNAVLLS